jgi:aryl-alcohol dehydrogenase (NADP+)
MEYRRLGASGLTVSRICLGTMTYGDPQWRRWVLPEHDAGPVLTRALDLGINFFDTADMYSRGVSEEILGRFLRHVGRRDELVVATKVFFPHGDGPNQRGLSRKHIFDAVDSSLRRLGLDYIDLYQIHRWDPATPIDETLGALDDLVRSGRVRYIGASSMYAWQFATSLYRAERSGFTRFVSMQNHYNLAYREEEREMLPLCAAEGVGVIPWSPLARGFLAGNRPRPGAPATLRAETDGFAHQMYYTPADFAIADRLAEVAAERGVTAAQVALAWLLAKPAVTAPIVGARTVGHLEAAVAALDIVLGDEEIDRLEEPYVPHPVLGHS